MTTISLTVNGRGVTAEVEPRMHLADFLREHELLTGTHLGCEHGICGACTVLIDGAPARACITYPAALDGAEITTIEGFDDDEVMGSLREAFSAEHALQCGYCTPGMLIMARDIVLRLPGADSERIRSELAGNLCRCTGYVGIVRGVGRVIEARGDVPAVARQVPVSAARPVAAATAAAETARRAPPAQIGEARVEQAAGDETKITQSFVVNHPRGKVWDFFQDPKQVVACMPGAEITEVGADGQIAGRMRIKVGPLAAQFFGEGEISADPERFAGTISGRGADQSSATQARGRVDYALSEPDVGTTQVDVAVAYTMVGPLAQISRGGIVRDLAARLTAAFAENLEAALSGREASAAPRELRAGGLLMGMLKDFVRRLFRAGR